MGNLRGGLTSIQDLLKDSQHYWVTAQSELSTDILFKSRQQSLTFLEQYEIGTGRYNACNPRETSFLKVGQMDRVVCEGLGA